MTTHPTPPSPHLPSTITTRPTPTPRTARHGGTGVQRVQTHAPQDALSPFLFEISGGLSRETLRTL